MLLVADIANLCTKKKSNFQEAQGLEENYTYRQTPCHTVNMILNLQLVNGKVHSLIP